MSQQDYDFFATGSREEAPVVPPPPPAPRPGQFSGAVDPQGRPVNQFGTPIGEVAAPVGPNAAPGYGAAPVAGPGLNSSWSGPSMGPAHAAPAWGPPPGAPAYAMAPSQQRPGTVLAAGVIAIVLGAITALGGLVLLLEGASLGSALAEQGAGGAEAALIIRIAGFIVLAIGVAYVVIGTCIAMSKRWAAWTLLVLMGLGVVSGFLRLIASSMSPTGVSATQVIGLLLSAGFLSLLLTPSARAWLRRR